MELGVWWTKFVQENALPGAADASGAEPVKPPAGGKRRRRRRKKPGKGSE
jgi:hypothetical protein